MLQRIVAPAVAAFIGLLAGIELRIYEEAVLQAVDPRFGGLLVGHGAQVTQYFWSALMCFNNHRAQFRTRDVNIRLE
jgi:hypothetical protein